MKKIVLCLLCIATLMPLTGCSFSKEKEKEGTKTEQKDQAIIIEDQQIGSLSFESFNIVLDDNNISHIYFEVINKGPEISNTSKVTFIIYKEDTQLLTLTKSLDAPIEANDMRIIEVPVDIDLSEATKVEYIIE